jgi:DNA repair protein RecO (recombination protein O)
MKVDLSPAFILHHRPYRESSRLLDVLSLQQGRVNLIVKGSKTIKKQSLGLMQLYQPLLLSWQGYGELQTVTSLEALKPSFLLTGKASLCGLYANELLVRLLPKHISEPELYLAYEKLLMTLESVTTPDIALRLFEKSLLNSLGYGLQLEYEIQTGNRIQEEKFYFYQPDAGIYSWDELSRYPKISGRSLRHLQHEAEFDDSSLNEIKKMMRSVLHFYLGGKPLHSRQLFNSRHIVSK